MNKKNITLMVVAVLTLITFVGLATYAYFVGTVNTTRTSNVTATTERNNLVFDTNGGVMNLNVSASSMQRSQAGTVAAQNSTTLTVNLTANTDYSMVCTYDIIYEWTSTDKYTAHSSGVSSNEFTIKASIAGNSNTYEGTNNIANETDLSSLTYTNNSTTVVSGAQIDATGSTRSTTVWTLESKIYNVNANQTNLVNKNFGGRFKITNVSCVAGTAEKQPQILADFIINNAPKSGIDKVSNSPWILTSDHTGEYRYAGKNPDNYISFNGELWRIIGVMPNMEYCTGTYTDSTCSKMETGSLVKIIKNDSLGSMPWDDGSAVSFSYINNSNQLTLLKTTVDGAIARPDAGNFSNNWYTSSLKTTLQSKAYASDSHVAVVNWSLYGTGTYETAAEESPAAFYNKERNISSKGKVYSGRPTYWYGKVGLMYPSDYGYATNGGNTYNRTTCLGYQMGSWYSESYKTDCAGNSWLWYTDIEGSNPGSSGTNQWTLSPCSSFNDYVYLVYSSGEIDAWVVNTTDTLVRPSLYLKADTIYGGSGTGTWNDPYTIE